MIVEIKPTPKQFEAWQAFQNPAVFEIFLGGGAGGGKSWWLCETRLYNAYRFQGYKSFIARKELKRLMQSTYVTFTKVCQHHKIPETDWKLNGQYNYIEFKNGSRIDLLDANRQPSDPLYERFGSLEYSDGAFEEAGEIDFLAFDVLKGRVNRHLNDQLGIIPSVCVTGNPKKNWTYTRYYKRWKNGVLPPDIAFIQALYSDNPYAAKSYKETLSRTEDKATKERLMFGNWEYDDDPNVLMAFDAIEDIFTNTVEESPERYLTADVARYGSDKVVIKLWQGFDNYKTVTRVKQGIDVTAELIAEIARDERIPWSHCLVDEDGIGGGVVDINRGMLGFTANAQPLEDPRLISLDPYDPKPHPRPNYQSLKAQCSYLLAEWVNNRRIAVRGLSIEEREAHVEELGQIKSRDADMDGKLKIMPKDEIKERLGRSPDYADAMMMRMYFLLRRRSGQVGIVYH